MGTLFEQRYELDRKALRAHLLSLGLTEKSSKWQTVWARKRYQARFRKAGE